MQWKLPSGSRRCRSELARDERHRIACKQAPTSEGEELFASLCGWGTRPLQRRFWRRGHITTMNLGPVLSRRAFLRRGGLLAAGVGLGRLGLASAFAQRAASDYRALVCIFLAGGNDGHNTLLPLSGPNFDTLRALRGQLMDAEPLRITTRAGEEYGLNNGLAAIHPLWERQELAVVANLGLLARPTSRTDFLRLAASAPANLFSHSDQVREMQAGLPNASSETGWAGRIADATIDFNDNGTFPPVVSVAGPALFCVGRRATATTLIPGIEPGLDGLASAPSDAAAARQRALQEILSFDSGLALVQAASGIQRAGLELNALLRSASPRAKRWPAFPETSIGRQLAQVAEVVRLRDATGLRRQIFYCSLSGFDTHAAQGRAQWELLRQLGDAMAAFHTATVEMGIADRVTTFTSSEFGRTLQPSGTGTDHGWGNHQLVMGGAVAGDLYGRFPTLAPGGPDDAGDRGTLIPTTSLDQFGATLASWFGVEDASLSSIFPNLDNFGVRKLGFLGRGVRVER